MEVVVDEGIIRGGNKESLFLEIECSRFKMTVINGDFYSKRLFLSTLLIQLKIIRGGNKQSLFFINRMQPIQNDNNKRWFL